MGRQAIQRFTCDGEDCEASQDSPEGNCPPGWFSGKHIALCPDHEAGAVEYQSRMSNWHRLQSLAKRNAVNRFRSRNPEPEQPDSIRAHPIERF